MNNEADQNSEPACPQCGGQRVALECDPRMGLITGDFSYTHLFALACVECGYTALYVREPEKLKKFLDR